MEEQRAQGNSDEALFKLRAHLARLIGKSDAASLDDVIAATYGVLGQAPSLVLLATLEDALAVPLRPNVPGTTRERPNWSMALPGGLEALERAPLPRRIARALTRENTECRNQNVE